MCEQPIEITQCVQSSIYCNKMPLISDPADLAQLELASRVMQKLPHAPKIRQKPRRSAPAQPGLPKLHPNTSPALVPAITAAQAPLLSAINPASTGTAGYMHTEDGRGKEEMEIFGLGAVLLTAKTRATWNGALDAAVTSPSCCQKD